MIFEFFAPLHLVCLLLLQCACIIMNLAYFNQQNPQLGGWKLHGTLFPWLCLLHPSPWMGWWCKHSLERYIDGNFNEALTFCSFLFFYSSIFNFFCYVWNLHWQPQFNFYAVTKYTTSFLAFWHEGRCLLPNQKVKRPWEWSW